MPSADATAPFSCMLFVSAVETMSSAELAGISASETGAFASNVKVISDTDKSSAGQAMSSAEGMIMYFSSTIVSADTMRMSAGYRLYPPAQGYCPLKKRLHILIQRVPPKTNWSEDSGFSDQLNKVCN